MHGSDLDSYVPSLTTSLTEAGTAGATSASCKSSRRATTPHSSGSPDTRHTRTRHSSAWKQNSQGTANGLQGAQNAGLHQKSHGGPTPTQQKWAQKLGSTTIRSRPREPPTPHTAPSTPPPARAATGATRSSPWMWTQEQWTIVETSVKNRPTIPDTWLKIWDGGIESPHRSGNVRS